MLLTVNFLKINLNYFCPKKAIGVLSKEIEGYANKRTVTDEHRGELTSELQDIESIFMR